jgi:hypothetical protein
MIIPVLALVGVLLPVALGGRVGRLAGVRLRAVEVIVAAFVGQLLVISVLTGPPVVLEVVHVASYVAAAGTIWANRRVPGLLVLGAGAVANGVTIAVNGGTLPARAGALRTAGLADETGFVNSGVLPDPHLAFLGDVFAVPASWPLANVFSIGDVLIVAGAAYASLRICGTRWTPAWQVARRHAPKPPEPPRRPDVDALPPAA